MRLMAGHAIHHTFLQPVSLIEGELGENVVMTAAAALADGCSFAFEGVRLSAQKRQTGRFGSVNTVAVIAREPGTSMRTGEEARMIVSVAGLASLGEDFGQFARAKSDDGAVPTFFDMSRGITMAGIADQILGLQIGNRRMG